MSNSKPAIVAVDDDPQVLAAVGRDLRRHHGERFRVVSAPGGSEGLEAIQQLRERGAEVALFLVDQRMPDIEGTDLLKRVGPMYPMAAKVLLTAYADTDAAISAINDIGLDHYLMKPWDPPEQRLYPVLDDLLDEWTRRARPRFEGIRVMGTRQSPATDSSLNEQVPSANALAWVIPCTSFIFRIHPASFTHTSFVNRSVIVPFPLSLNLGSGHATPAW